MPTNSEQTREAALASAAQFAADGRIADAERVLKDALEHHSGDALMWFRLGSLYLNNENYMDAIGAFQHALKTDPENPLVLNDLGYVLDRTGDLEGAANAYALAFAVVDKALESKSDLVPAVLALGEISESRGETEKAVDYYARALLHEPSNAEALLKTAYLEMYHCRFDAAVQTFEAYIKQQPANEQVLLNLAACLQELGRSDEALEIYRRLLAEDRSRYYSVIKNLMSSARGVMWLRANELRRILLPDEA